MGGFPLSARRYLQAVTPPDDIVTGGRPKLWGYGIGYIARLARVSRRAVRRARAKGLDASSPVKVVAYALTKRGQPDAARAALALLEGGDDMTPIVTGAAVTEAVRSAGERG